VQSCGDPSANIADRSVVTTSGAPSSGRSILVVNHHITPVLIFAGCREWRALTRSMRNANATDELGNVGKENLSEEKRTIPAKYARATCLICKMARLPDIH
jgi:hypothetical protein